MKNLRKVTVFLAVISLLFLVINLWGGIDIPEEAEDIVELVAAVLVGLGILVDTSSGAELEPLTWERIAQKAKSPIAVGSMFALLSYIVYLRLAPADADAVMKIISTLILGIFGYSVGNSPNVQGAYR